MGSTQSLNYLRATGINGAVALRRAGKGNKAGVLAIKAIANQHANDLASAADKRREQTQTILAFSFLLWTVRWNRNDQLIPIQKTQFSQLFVAEPV